jgi:hypothetical protein
LLWAESKPTSQRSAAPLHLLLRMKQTHREKDADATIPCGARTGSRHAA